METTVESRTRNKITESDVNPGFGAYSNFFTCTLWKEKKWSEPKIYNNTWSGSQLTLSPFMNALHYGQSIFEGMKAHISKECPRKLLVFRPDEHLNRLNRSLETMGIPARISEKIFYDSLKLLFRSGIKGMLEKIDFTNGQGALYLRPIIFNIESTASPYAADQYAFVIGAAPVRINPYRFQMDSSEPIHAWVEDTYARAIPHGMATVKTAGNYAASMHVAKKAKSEKCAHALWLNANGHNLVEELSGMSFFMIKNGELHTPCLNHGTILPSITRKTIIEVVAPSLGVTVHDEHDITIDELLWGIEEKSVTGVFGAGTASTVFPFAGLKYRANLYNVQSSEGVQPLDFFDGLNKLYLSPNCGYVKAFELPEHIAF